MVATWQMRVLLLAFIGWITTSQAAAQTTIGFDGLTLGTFTPFSQTVGGVTATFSSPLDLTCPKFSVLSAARGQIFDDSRRDQRMWIEHADDGTGARDPMTALRPERCHVTSGSGHLT
jgi:hypothetical protein